MNGNINNLTKIYNENHKDYEFLEEFMYTTSKVSNNITVSSLLWLTRAIELTKEFLVNVLEDETCDDNLKNCLQKAYKKTLEMHHNFIIREMFSLAYRLVPSRKELFGSGDYYNENMKHLENYLKPAKEHISFCNNLLYIIK